MKISIIKNKTIKLLSFIFILLVWNISSELLGSEFIFPSPKTTFISLFSIVKSDIFLYSVVGTIKRGLVGFFISSILGILLGFAAGFNRLLRIIFEPFIIIIRSTPVMSIILIALMQFKTNNVPIFVSFLVVFPIIYLNVLEGIKSVDVKVIEMAKVYKVKWYRIILSIYIPSIVSFIISGMSTAFGIGWKAIIAAEVLSQPKNSIGFNLQTAKVNLDMEEVFAWTFVAIMLSFIFEKFIRIIEKNTIKWR
ncbi:putative aliphatic sulfonates transport permease protein SsuC [Clostridium acetireducens DSM 10703]|jgi:NitT/TauT family transport system permease protein|uniref:Putative aliphatic sulfonates transport permease protein SsuC n=1 Tax=Clostridium acetireducens DSM 10703 TaxID=1121290 RepID=A0A1E8EWB7_9CLOT|nr:ABC transporter permease subunit [Clostridium acetireducens]OFI01520.1 putative aliphatic sulfonates transport permease protein SsuC [Clostridium acetireducens DSM 10703]